MNKKLKEYNAKRNFDKTAEPKGKTVSTKTSKLKFAVQHHLARKDHFDLRLEWNGVLLSWAIPKGPSFDPSDKRLAIQVEDHPMDYIHFEGTIPKGQYGGGTVMLWDKGFWEPLKNVNSSLKSGILKFTLRGKRLKGEWSLIKLKSKETKNDNDNWILVKEKDEFANTLNPSNYNTSIKTRKTMSQIEKKTKTNLTTSLYNKINNQLSRFDNTDEFQVGKIQISSANKILFASPQTTKIDLIKYYAKVSQRMLPYLANRILSIVRCPQGLASECFFKKHPATTSEGIVPINIINSENEQEQFFYIENIFGLIFEVQMNTIEFHIWGSKIDKLEQPDFMVFDLDPDKGMDIKKVRQGVRDLKKILDNLSITSFLKTSGGKGYHVVVPFKPSASWDKFYDFAKNVSVLMEQTWPNKYTSNIRKINRKGKIFVDWQRNSRGATTVAPYSVRAKEGATVSMPISWEELGKVAPNGITIKQAIKRLDKPDPWKDFFKTNQTLNS